MGLGKESNVESDGRIGVVTAEKTCGRWRGWAKVTLPQAYKLFCISDTQDLKWVSAS